MPEISLTAYGRSEANSKRLHVKVYDDALPKKPKRMEVRAGDVCLYLDVNDARALAEAMLAEIKVAAA